MTDWPAPALPSWNAGSRPARLVRAGVFAAVSLLLAEGAHRLAGGAAPHPPVVTLAAGLLFAFGYALSRRERSGGPIAVLVLATQALLHIGFMLSQMSGSMSGSMSSPPPLSTAELAKLLFCFPGTATPSEAQVSAAMAGMPISHLGGSEPVAAGMTMPMHHNPFTAAGLGMLTAHLAAALAMAWWLRRGERAAWTVLERAVATLTTAGIPTSVPNGMTVLPMATTPWLPPQQVWGAGRAGRGPPRPLPANFLTA